MARKIITCSACGARFDVSKYPAGSRVRCGRCNQVLTVPLDEALGAPPVVQPSGPASRSVGPATKAAPLSAASSSQRGPQTPDRAGGAETAPQRTLSAVAAPPESDPLLGRVIHGQYRIVRKLGEGGYGAVYEATDVNLERRVAIKIMLQARAQSREYVAKFLREARTAAQLSHPNVVAVHGVGFDRDLGVHFLAMEYVDGRTFHDILQERGPLPVDEACNLIIQSCRGLHAAHERNIIHRDIKPGNLMITPGGAVKITDFGLAKIYDEAAAQSTVIGTPYFMPPEQFEGKAKDGRTDVYALGVTFYYMLTLQRPHTGAGPAQILLSVMTKEPASVLEHRPDLPEGLWPIVKRMIHRDLDRRYATCAEVIADLEQLLGGGQEEIEQIYCPSCGVPNEIDATECKGCKESLQEKCPACGAVDAAGTKFCGDCGANIPVERVVLGQLEEAQALLQSGRLTIAEERIASAQDRSPQNLKVAQLLRDLEVRREQRDAHRDAIRDLLAGGRPEEALERWKTARAEFPESAQISDLEPDIRTALAAQESTGAASADAVAGAKKLEEQGRTREALVAWRGVLVLLPGNDEALQGETRCRERVEKADSLAADAAELLREGDPEAAQARLIEAVELLPKDPVIEGKLRAAQRAVTELQAELADIEKDLAASPTDDAMERLRILVARHPTNRRAREALSRAEHAGRAASAGAVRDRIQRARNSAKQYEELRHMRDAVAAWREVVQLDPDTTDAEEGLARAQDAIAESEARLGQSRSLLSSGDPEGAVAAAEQALALLADDPAAAAQLARARTTFETMKHEADRIRAALGNDTDEDVLNWARELAARFPASALASDTLRETERVCREAEEKASESRAKSLLGRARKLEEQRQFERAAEAFEEAVRVAPGNVEAKNALEGLRDRLATAAAKTDGAQGRLDAGDPEGAKSLAAEALKLLPDEVRATRVLAAARTAIAEIERAHDAFEADPSIALDRAEAQVERFTRLRGKYAESKRCEELVARAQKVLDDARVAAQRQRIAARIAAAEQAFSEGRLGDAEKAALEAKELEPKDSAVAAILGRIEERRAQSVTLAGRAQEAQESARLAEALALFDEALAADPGNVDAATGRAAAAAALERAREQVRKAQGEAIQADRAGHPRVALAAWQRVLEIDATHDKARHEVERLEAWIVRADEAIAKVRERIEKGDPEAALAAAQEARLKLGAWDQGEEALREARSLAEEVDRGVRKIERELGAQGELTRVADTARSLSEKFPGSAKARDCASRAAAAAEERRRALAIAQVRKLVREHHYEDAVALAAELRGQGVVSGDLDVAEAQAKKILGEVSALRKRAAEARETGDLEVARTALSQVHGLLPEDEAARDAVREIDETLREVTARIDAAESARRRGELARALEAYNEALGLNPTSTEIKTRLKSVGTQRKKRSELIRHCETAIRGGDGDTCSKAAKDLLSLFPDDDQARALQTTGEALRTLVASLLIHAKRQREEGEMDSAKATIECLLRVAPEHAEARALLS